MQEDQKTEVERFVRYGVVLQTMQEAFTFVMEYMEKVGPVPMVEILPCFNPEDDSFLHYHVAVSGVDNGGPAKGEYLGHH